MPTFGRLTVSSAKARKKQLALAVAAIAYIVHHLYWKFCRRPRNVTYVKGHWLLGNILESARAAARNDIHGWLFTLHQKYGPTIALEPPFPIEKSAIITTNPENVEHILKTNFDNYPKGFVVRRNLGDLLGDGIFNVDGKLWYHQRKTTSGMFTANAFKEHIWSVIRKNTTNLRCVLFKSAADETVDIFNLMNRFTLDSIGEIGFGKSIGSLDDPASPFLKSFDRAQQICFLRFVNPTWWLQRFLQVGAEKDTKEHIGRLDEYSRSLVRELQAGLKSDDADNAKSSWVTMDARKSFVGLFLADAQKRGETIEEDFLRDLVLNFLIAGRDTTAQALSWTIFCLCQHPDIELKVLEELRSVCGGEDPRYDDMNRLPYLQAVISEALRLYPSVPIDAKIAENDDTFPDGTFVPAGSMVFYNMYSMGRDSIVWGDDAETFRPERWMEMAEPPSNYKYPIFNAGPRECLGKRLAQVEMKACLAMLLPQVSFKLAVPPKEIITDSQLTIGMGRGLPCFVSARAPSGENVQS